MELPSYTLDERETSRPADTLSDTVCLGLGQSQMSGEDVQECNVSKERTG